MSRDRRRFFFLAGRALVAAVSGWAVLSASVPAAATPGALFGAGPRNVALAGGGTSLPLGPESVLVNPAELALHAKKSLLFGMRASHLSLSVETAQGRTPFPTEQSKGLMIGVVAPLFPPRTDSWRLALGLFAETPPDFLVRAHLPLAEETSFPLLVQRAGALDLGVGLGAGYGRFTFGAGVEVLAALSGRDVVAGTGGSATGVGDELLPAWGPGAGVGVDLGVVGRLGLAFRSELRADFDVDVAAANLGGVIGIAPLHVQGVAHYEPLKLDVELSRAFDAWTLLLGARYERWSNFPGWVGRTVDCPAGVPCGTAEPEPPDYSDVVVPRLGAERRFESEKLTLTARAGYSFVPSATPEQRARSNAFDAARHALAAGYQVRIARHIFPLELEGALRLDLLAPRTHHKTGAAAEGPLGPEVTTRGAIVTWVFGARVEL